MALSSQDYGYDLASVQALKRKHEGIERDLSALEEKVRKLPYNAGPNLTLGPLTPALITSVSNCAEYKKVYISAFNGNIRQKIS